MERIPARIIALEFDRSDLAEFAENMRLACERPGDEEARLWLRTALARISAALGTAGDPVTVEAKADSWRRLALESLRFESGRVGSSLIRRVHMADRRAEQALTRREQDVQQAGWKQEADALRAREAAGEVVL